MISQGHLTSHVSESSCYGGKSIRDTTGVNSVILMAILYCPDPW